MSTLNIVKNHFYDSIEAKKIAVEAVSQDIVDAGKLMVESLSSGGKILACGNGGSAADAQHFSAELLNRFEIERPPLAAIALTTDSSTLTAVGNDYDYVEVFSKQVYALGNNNDVLLAISTSGNSKNVIEAIKVAHNKGVKVVALVGKDGGEISKMLKNTDINICIPVFKTSRIQENHIVVIHCLCDFIDKVLYPKP